MLDRSTYAKKCNDHGYTIIKSQQTVDRASATKVRMQRKSSGAGPVQALQPFDPFFIDNPNLVLDNVSGTELTKVRWRAFVANIEADYIAVVR